MGSVGRCERAAERDIDNDFALLGGFIFDTLPSFLGDGGYSYYLARRRGADLMSWRFAPSPLKGHSCSPQYWCRRQLVLLMRPFYQQHCSCPLIRQLKCTLHCTRDESADCQQALWHEWWDPKPRCSIIGVHMSEAS